MDEYWLEPDDPRVLRLQQAAPPCIQIEVDDSPEYRGRRHRRLGYHYVASGYTRFAYYLGPFTDEMLEDFALVLESIDRGDCDDMNDINIYATDLFMYIEGGMIGDKEVTLTITDITLETMNSGKGGQQTKPCLRFKERSKLMVLNKTNAKTLAGFLGPETENWKGARVTIAAPVVDAFGKSARSLRITDVQPPAQIPVKTRNGNSSDDNWRDTAPTYADGSPVSPFRRPGYDEYMAANDGQPPADVRALIAWQQGEPEQSDLFSDGDPAAKQAALDTAQGRLG